VTETDIEAHSVQQILATFHSFIHSFYFTEQKLHKNDMKIIILSVPLDRKALTTARTDDTT